MLQGFVGIFSWSDILFAPHMDTMISFGMSVEEMDIDVSMYILIYLYMYY